MRYSKKLFVVSVITFGMLASACSQEALSERDLARQQARARADIKRSELVLVSGIFRGELVQANNVRTNSLLNLEIQDLPTAVEGQVDPVLIPTLTGYLHLIVGGGEGEFFNYSVTRSEYDPGQERLTFVASNPQFKEIFFSLKVRESQLSGSWNAPEAGNSGSVLFSKKVEPQKNIQLTEFFEE